MGNFAEMSRPECLKQYTEILKHAEVKFHSGDKLAEHGDYGTALSTQIIGLEELIKAVVLFADGKGFEFRNVEGMNGVFRNHGLRYLISFFLFVFNVFGESLEEGIAYCREKAATEEGRAEHKKMMSNKEESFNQQLLPYLKERIQFVISELCWYSSFDSLRQRGFYTDYDGALHTPIDIEEQYYLEFMERLDAVKKTVFGIISSFNSDHPFVEKYLPITIQDFKQKGMYDALAQILRVTKSRKKNALVIISEQLGEFSAEMKEWSIQPPSLK